MAVMHRDRWLRKTKGCVHKYRRKLQCRLSLRDAYA